MIFKIFLVEVFDLLARTIILAAGGTGGHVFPAQALEGQGPYWRCRLGGESSLPTSWMPDAARTLLLVSRPRKTVERTRWWATFLPMNLPMSMTPSLIRRTNGGLLHSAPLPKS